MCHRSLPPSSFTRDKHTSTGLSSTCRDCQRQLRMAMRARRTGDAYDTDLGMCLKQLKVTFEEVARWSKVSRVKLELKAQGLQRLEWDESCRVRGVLEGVRLMGRRRHVG